MTKLKHKRYFVTRIFKIKTYYLSLEYSIMLVTTLMTNIILKLCLTAKLTFFYKNK